MIQTPSGQKTTSAVSFSIKLTEKSDKPLDISILLC